MRIWRKKMPETLDEFVNNNVSVLNDICYKCKNVIQTHVTGRHKITIMVDENGNECDAGTVKNEWLCDDCYWDEIGDEIDKHGIGYYGSKKAQK